jgi:hypothetical protein
MNKALLSELVNASSPMDGETPDQRTFRLTNMIIDSVHLVDKGANKRTFAIRKSATGAPLDVTEKADGTLTTQKADVLPASVKASMLAALTAATERLLAVLSRVKDATEGKTGTEPVPADLDAELKDVAAMVAAATEPNPTPGSAAGDDKETPMAMNQDQVAKFAAIKKELTVALVGGEQKKKDMQAALYKLQDMLWQLKPDESSFKMAVDELASALSGASGGAAVESQKADGAVDETPCPECGKFPCECTEEMKAKKTAKSGTEPPMEPTKAEKAMDAMVAKMDAMLTKFSGVIEKALCGDKKKAEGDPDPASDPAAAPVEAAKSVQKSATPTVPSGNGSSAPERSPVQKGAKGNSSAWESGGDLNSEPFSE